VPRELQPCGTPAAYRRHLRNHETPCPSCRRAKQEEKRQSTQHSRHLSIVGGTNKPKPEPQKTPTAGQKTTAQVDREQILANALTKVNNAFNARSHLEAHEFKSYVDALLRLTDKLAEIQQQTQEENLDAIIDRYGNPIAWPADA
jgi:hypothetical protein